MKNGLLHLQAGRLELSDTCATMLWLPMVLSNITIGGINTKQEEFVEDVIRFGKYKETCPKIACSRKALGIINDIHLASMSLLLLLNDSLQSD